VYRECLETAVKYPLNIIFWISRGGLEGSNIPDRRKSYLFVCAGRGKLPQIVQIGIAFVIPRRALSVSCREEGS